MKRVIASGLIFSLLLPADCVAKEGADTATVQIPRTEYDRILLERLNIEEGVEQSPRYAFGDVSIFARLEDEEHRIKGEIITDIQLEILRDKYTTVAILPLGTKLKTAQADGKKIRLISTPDGLCFGGTKGRYQLRIVTSIDERAEGAGRGIALALPGGTSARLTADISGTEISPTIAPALTSEITLNGDRTTVTAEIPESAQTMLTWRRGRDVGFAASKGSYVGELVGDESVYWKGEISMEVFDREGVTYKLLPITTTMSAVSVDGAESTLIEESGWHAVRVKGGGKHKIQLEFIIPVATQGSPGLSFEAPHVPVSRYELKLPGKKTVKVGSGADVQTTAADAGTKAVAHFPPSVPISFAWTEEVPKEAEAVSQVYTAIYESVIAEEGLLAADALAVVEVARGEKTSLDFTLPAGVQINKVTGPENVRTDWRVISQDSKQLVRVFFERGLKGEFSLQFSYDRPLGATAGGEVEIPLLTPIEVQRSRGMIALLSSKEFSFDPSKEVSLTRVGENQIPALWRRGIDKPVVHTFKYAGADPSLTVKLAVPEKIRGKVDAVVDTLISVGDVSIKGNAAIDVVLKSGKLSELDLELPTGLNILNVVAPSLRTHQITTVDGKQKIALQFTQEMEGTFLVQLTYERIFGEAGDDVSVPTVSVDGAEVEQGRVAIEALSAVEIQAIKTERLSSLEPSELPKRLLMNTSNPILLGFKYFQADPPHELRLKVVRHTEVEPQSAIIDSAHYRTLITKDGIAVTTANLTMRNSRKQFLKLVLPAKSEMWSATVDGKVEKPALEIEKDGNKEPGVLIRLVNSADPFQVQLVYKTPVQAVRFFGTISSMLPKPDMVVSRSAWTVVLPAGAHFGHLATNMEIDQQMGQRGAMPVARHSVQLPIQVMPESEEGPQFTLTRLYATEALDDSNFSVVYLSGSTFYVAIALFAAALGIAFGASHLKSRKAQAGVALSGISAAALIGYYVGISLWIPVLVLIGLRALEKLAPLGRRFLESQVEKVAPEAILEPQED